MRPPDDVITVLKNLTGLLDPATGRTGFAYFEWHYQRPTAPTNAWIFVAAAVAELGGMEEMLRCFAHELGHYEQWRAGEPVSEAKAEARANELVAAYNRSRKGAVKTSLLRGETKGGNP